MAVSVKLGDSNCNDYRFNIRNELLVPRSHIASDTRVREEKQPRRKWAERDARPLNLEKRTVLIGFLARDVRSGVHPPRSLEVKKNKDNAHTENQDTTVVERREQRSGINGNKPYRKKETDG